MLDVGGAAPVHPAAIAAWSDAVGSGWADPRRLHAEARTARRLLDGARESLAATLGYRADEVFFPPHHPAAAQAGVLGLAAARRRATTVVVGAVEHSAVLHAATWHESHGGRVAVVEADALGRVHAATVARAIDDAPAGTAVVAVQSGNGEVGTYQPIEGILAVTRERGVPLVVDAAATLGWGQHLCDVDVLIGSPRAWGSVAGVGLLVKRSAVRWRPHEAGEAESARRLPGEAAGEVDIPAAVAAAASLQAIEADRLVAARLSASIDRVRRAAADVPDVVVYGDPDDRAPHIVTFSVLYLPGELVVDAFDTAGIAVGSGSACTSDTLEPSHVLAAMGGLTHGNVRLVLPRTVTDAEIDRFCVLLPEVIERLRRQTGVSDL